MNHFFYSSDIFDEFIIIGGDEAHHAIKVLRKKEGDIIFVVDGLGGVYETIIENAAIDDCKLKIMNKKKNYHKPDHYIHIAICPTKSHDRLEWFIEKSVELGIQEISFLKTQRTERDNVKINRIVKRSISSMKQSLKAYLPIINDMVDFNYFIKNCTNNHKYIGHLNHENTRMLSHVAPAGKNYCVMIGPEGDFTDKEILDAKDNEFDCILLNQARLRTETAGLAACQILNIINQNEF